MSMFNNSYTNEIDIRTRKSTSDQFWVKDDETGEYVRLLPGGGSGGDSHYYLKPNSIVIDSLDGMGFTRVDENSVDVSQGVNNSTLTASSLALSDGTTTETLDKDKMNLLTKLKNGVDEAEVANSVTILAWDPSAKVFDKNPQSWRLQKDISNYFLFSVANGYIQNSIPDYYTRVGASTFYVRQTSTSTNATLSPTTLSFSLNNVFATLDRDDIAVTNKLKALTTTAPGANSKMLIYDTGTTAFNYADIPSGGGVLPYYLKTNSILLDNTALGTPMRIQCKDDYDVSTISSGRVEVADGLNSHTVSLDTASALGGIVRISKNSVGAELFLEDIQLTNKLKALTIAATTANSNTIIYDDTTKAFNFTPVKNKYIKYSPPDAVSLPLASEASLNSGSTVLNYGMNKPRIFASMSLPDDTLWIDFGNDGRTNPSFTEIWHLPLVFGVDSGLSQTNTVVASYYGGAVTVAVHPNVQINYTDGIVRTRNGFVFSLTIPPGVVLNGVLRITMQRPTLPNRLPDIPETSPTLA